MKRYKIFMNADEKTIYTRRLLSETTEEYYEFIRNEEFYTEGQQLIITEDIMSEIVKHYSIIKKYAIIKMVRMGEIEHIPDTGEESIDKLKALMSLEENGEDYIKITLKKNDEIVEVQTNGILSTNTPIDNEMLKIIQKSYF